MKKMLALLMLLCLLPAFASAAVLVDGVEVSGTYTINTDNATISGTGTDVKLIVAENVSSVTLNGVSITTTTGSPLTITGSTTVKLTGTSTLDASGAAGYAGIQTVGATVSGNSPRAITASGAHVTLSGSGMLTVKGGEEAAGIGGGNGADGYVTIAGGKINAYGGKSAAAIGSGYNASAHVTITGGTVNVKDAMCGTGIGAGDGNSKTEYAHVNITGGTVNIAEDSCWYGIGANNAVYTHVQINGGSVTAWGSAAGIGADKHEAQTTYAYIEIGGGTVKASGEVGIGGECKSVTLNLSGGTLYAEGDEHCMLQGATNNNIHGIVHVNGYPKSSVDALLVYGSTNGVKYEMINSGAITEDDQNHPGGTTGSELYHYRYMKAEEGYRVSFDANGGSGNMVLGGAKYGGYYTLPECTFSGPSGKQFAGWEINGVTRQPGDSIQVKKAVTAKAIWSSAVKVYFSMGGNEAGLIPEKYMDPVTLTPGSTYTLPDCEFDIHFSNYAFDCWEIDGEEYVPGDTITVTKDTTAYAMYVCGREVTYYSYETGKDYSFYVSPNRAHKLLTPEKCGFPMPTGMNFDGWLYNGQLYQPGDKVTLPSNVNRGVVFYTQFSKDVKLTFIPGDPPGESVLTGTMDPVWVKSGIWYKLPACEYTRTNYEFRGWYVNSSIYQPGREAYIGTSDMTIEALWNGEYQKITYENGDEIKEDKCRYYEYYTFSASYPCRLTAPTGHKLGGWTINGQTYTSTGPRLRITGPTTAVPTWVPLPYKVTYTDGTTSTKVDVKYGDKYVLEGCGFEKPGYAFAGWDIGGTVYPAGEPIDITGDVTATATWTESKYKVTYIDGDYRVEVAVKYGDVFVPDESMVKPADGYHLAGWIIDGTKYDLGSVPQGTIGGDVTVSPVWEANKHTVTYTDGTNSTTVGVKYGEEHVLEGCGFEKPGHTFAGWQIGESVYPAGEKYTITGDVTATATWTDLYDVNFNVNGGTGTMATEYADATGKYTLPACGFTAPQNAVFGYWVVGESTEGQMPGWEITLTGDTVVKAIWDIGESKTKTETVSTGLEEVNIDQISKTLIEALGKTNEDAPEEVIAEIIERMETSLTDLGVSDGQMAHYEVELMISYDDGNTWVKATPENFPKEGLTVTIPYPEGTNRFDFMFTVVHMFAEGDKAGLTEMPDVTLTDDGVTFTVTGLSPISIGWMPKPAGADLPQTGDPSSLAAWMALLGASGIGLKAIRRRKK